MVSGIEDFAAVVVGRGGGVEVEMVELLYAVRVPITNFIKSPQPRLAKTLE